MIGRTGVGRKPLSSETLGQRGIWKQRLRQLLSEHPLRSRDLARDTQRFARELGLDGLGVQPTAVDHWRSPKPNSTEAKRQLRVPGSSLLAHAFVLALKSLGVFDGMALEERARRSRELIELLDFEFFPDVLDAATAADRLRIGTDRWPPRSRGRRREEARIRKRRRLVDMLALVRGSAGLVVVADSSRELSRLTIDQLRAAAYDGAQVVLVIRGQQASEAGVRRLAEDLRYESHFQAPAIKNMHYVIGEEAPHLGFGLSTAIVAVRASDGVLPLVGKRLRSCIEGGIPLGVWLGIGIETFAVPDIEEGMTFERLEWAYARSLPDQPIRSLESAEL